MPNDITPIKNRSALSTFVQGVSRAPICLHSCSV